MATITVTPNAPGAGGYDSDGNQHRVSGTWSAAGTYTPGGDTFTVPGLSNVVAVVAQISAPAAAAIEATVAAGKIKLITSAAEVGAVSIAGLAGTFVAWGT